MTQTRRKPPPPRPPLERDVLHQPSAKVLSIKLPDHLAVKASRPSADAMNKTERRYADYLETRRLVGEIWRWDFEAVKLRLADSTFYTPDFRVILADGTEEFHEVKGHWEDDARVKIKVAAEQHPYRFVAVRSAGNRWEHECFEGKKR